MLSLLRCFEDSRVTSGRNLPAVKLCSVIDALVLVTSDAETAAADDQQYWALFGLRVYAGRGRSGARTAPSKLVALRQIGCFVASRERLLACARRQESSFGPNARRNPYRRKTRREPGNRLWAAVRCRPGRSRTVGRRKSSCVHSRIDGQTPDSQTPVAADAASGKVLLREKHESSREQPTNRCNSSASA